MRRSATSAPSLIGCLAGLVSALGSCDPYGSYDNEDEGLGPVDPVTFPPASIGAGGDRKRPGRGIFSETSAFVAGDRIGYFGYAAPSAGVRDPLRILEDGKPLARVWTTYVFDPTDTRAFPDKYACTPPAGYSFDRQRDEVPYDQQGNIFTILPSATYTEGVAVSSTYVPVVAEAKMSSSGLPCQQLKSEAQFAKKMIAKPPLDGKYLAWMIIDPAAGVYPKEDQMGMMRGGVGLQRWGWYNRYLVAYLDGGYLPTGPEMDVNDGTMAMPVMHKVVRAVTQRLLIPKSVLPTAAGAMPSAGQVGAGYDVLDARLGQPGYSPLCEVWTYDTSPGMGMPPLMVSDLPKDAQAIMDMFGPTLVQAPAASRYIYCLQVRQ
jgi:hypothetical protein